MLTRSRVKGLFASGLLLAAILACNLPKHEKPVLTREHRGAIRDALAAKHLPDPDEIVLTDGEVLAVTFTLDAPPLTKSLRQLGEECVVTVRNAMYPYKTVENYRVTLNGPSPGPGMIRRYGSARLFAGGPVEWEAGIK